MNKELGLLFRSHCRPETSEVLAMLCTVCTNVGLSRRGVLIIHLKLLHRDSQEALFTMMMESTTPQD
jgi:hypothetical protein